MKDFVFENGRIVRDLITGFQGCVRSRADYLTGCNRYAVQQRELDKDGNRREWQWIDEDELELVTSEAPVVLKKRAAEKKEPQKKSGGPLRPDQTPPQ